MVCVYINVRRFDLENSTPVLKEVNINPELGYKDLKELLQTTLGLPCNGCNKVLKLRNHTEYLIPLTEVFHGNTIEKPFYLDVTEQHSCVPLLENSGIFIPVYTAVMSEKMSWIEKRLKRLEELAPTLQWRQQVQLDDIVHKLSTKIDFLNRRIDELSPPEWQEHFQNPDHTKGIVITN